MASSSSGTTSIPAPEAVQVLVSSLADESTTVREASMASLMEIASLNPLLVLDCCSTVSRGGRRRFGNMAGVFQVMALGVRSLSEQEVDPLYVSKLAKIATAEMISSKELNADWQRAAARLLVSIGSHLPDLMMEEIYLHLPGTSSALPAMVQILADFASADALKFTPRLKGVLSLVLPILGNVRDVHRPIFANAFKCWCQAALQYTMDFPSHSLLDADVMSFLHSAFDLLLRVWANSRDLKIPSIHIHQYTSQILGVIVALLDDSDESVQLTAVTCLLMVLASSPNDAVEPILPNLSVRLRNLLTCMHTKIRATAFAAFGALSSYAVGTQQEMFLEQIHAAIPRLVLHLHDDYISVRQACRETFKRIAPSMDMEGLTALLTSHSFTSDHRSYYEAFIRDFSRLFSQHLPSKVDTYMASTIQALDAPWPIIQANAIYMASSMLSLSKDQRILAVSYTQVFGMLVGKMKQSADAVVRATCSSSVALLLKSTNSLSWRTDRLDRVESIRRNQDAESKKYSMDRRE